VKPFVNGGASGMLATCVIQPIDMVKVSYALSPERGSGHRVGGQWSRPLYLIVRQFELYAFAGWLRRSGEFEREVVRM
jgi:hypothetical protein